MTRTLLIAALVGLSGVLIYRRLLLPWHKGNAPTMAERRKAFLSSPDESVMPPRAHRRTQPAKPSRWWVRTRLTRHRSA